MPLAPPWTRQAGPPVTPGYPQWLRPPPPYIPARSGGKTLWGNAEAGSNGSGVLAADTGSGNAWDTVTTLTATVTYDNATAAHGSQSYLFTSTATGQNAHLNWAASFVKPATNQIGGRLSYFRFCLYFAALPPADIVIYAPLGQIANQQVRLLTTGAIRTINSAGSTLATSATTLSTGTWHRIEGMTFYDTAAGVFEVKIFTGANDTAEAEMLRSTGIANAANSWPINWTFGANSLASANTTFRMDDIALSNCGYPGPAPLSFVNVNDYDTAAATDAVTGAVSVKDTGFGQTGTGSSSGSAGDSSKGSGFVLTAASPGTAAPGKAKPGKPQTASDASAQSALDSGATAYKPIGSPVHLGSAVTSSANNSVISGLSTNAGDAIFVATTVAVLATSVTGITDSQGNVYRQIKRYNTAGAYDVELWVANYGPSGPGTATKALIGDFVTVTWSGTQTAPRVEVFSCAGIDRTASAADVAKATNASSGTAPSSGATGTLAQAAELAVGIISDSNTGGPVTWGGGFTSVQTVHTGSTEYMNVATQILGSTTGVTATGTIVSTNWTAMVATFKAAAITAVDVVPAVQETGTGADTATIKVSDSDTMSSAEAGSAAPSGTQVSDSDTASAADALVSLGIDPDTEAATGTEGTPSTGIASPDTATAADAQALGPLSSDSATATDAGEIVNPQGSETGSATDAGTIGIASADTAAAADAASGSLGITVAGDSLTAAENTPTVAVSSSDTGSLDDEGVAGVPVSSADTGSFTDAFSGSLGITAAGDSATGTDTSSTGIASADTGSSSDALVSVGPQSPDTGSLADTSGALALSAADTATGSETQNAIGISSADTGSAAEAELVAANPVDADAGSFTEAAHLGIPGTDTATSAEAHQLGLAGTDTAAAAEAAQLALTGADSAALADAAFIGVSSPDSLTAADAVLPLGISAADSASAADAGFQSGIIGNTPAGRDSGTFTDSQGFPLTITVAVTSADVAIEIISAPVTPVPAELRVSVEVTSAPVLAVVGP